MIYPPEPKAAKKHAPSEEQTSHADAVARVWQWVHDPANAEHPMKASFESFLKQCQRMADMVTRFEELRVEVLTLRAHNTAYRRAFDQRAEEEELPEEESEPEEEESLLVPWEEDS